MSLMAEYDDPHQWTTGDQPDLEHVRLIATGSFGTAVHELRRLTDQIVFARKIIHVQKSQQDPTISNELRVMEKICTGGHRNIIKIYGDGQLRNSTFHFIDMELCDFDLKEYLLCRTGINQSRVPQDFIPTEYGTVQIWDIMRQIAEGVAFIHSHGEVHRDLKPRNVLYCIPDHTWKVADFGLTSEGTSTRHISTEFSHGTPGYRAPELLNSDVANFTNKVDIWAMGCILFELATGAKPFVTDIAVLEYSRGGSEIEAHCHANIISDMVEKISDAIQKMFEILPSARPKSVALAQLFSKYYQLAKDLAEFEQTGSAASPHEVHESSSLNGLVAIFVNKNQNDSVSFLSSTTRPTENLNVFRSISPLKSFHANSKSGSGNPLERTFVNFSLANSNSFRVVTVSRQYGGSNWSLIELWDAGTGSLLWEKEGKTQFDGPMIIPQPRFSEDGRYLVVYDGTWVEIVNAHSAQSTGVVAVKGFIPEALTVGNNGTSIAISRGDLGNRGFGPGALFEKSFLDEDRSPIDLVSTCSFTAVQLCYVSDGDRLVLVGHFTEPHLARVVLMIWDVKSGSTIHHSICGEKLSSIDGPIFPITHIQGKTAGFVITLNERRWMKCYDEDDYDYDENNTKICEKLTTFNTFTSEGLDNGTHVAEHKKAVCGVVGDEIVIIKNRNYLWSWKGGIGEPTRIGRIDFEGMPRSERIFAFAMSHGRFTISSRYDPTGLVFLGVEEPKQESIASIVLTKKSKRKASDL